MRTPRKHWASAVVAVGLLFLAESFGQTTNIEGESDSSRPPNTRPRRGSGLGPPVNLVGRVVMDTGESPTQMIQVELVCNGRIKYQTPTSPGGTFSFDLGSPRKDEWLDPAVGGRYDGSLQPVGTLSHPGFGRTPGGRSTATPGRVELDGCEIRVAPSAGFSSKPINLRTRGPMDNPDVGVLILRRLSASAATTVSLNTLSAPRKAQEAFQKASEEIGKEKPDLKKASRLLRRATEEFPRFSAAWELLARVQMTEGKTADARESLLRAVEAEPGFISPYLVLAQISIQQSDWSETAEWTGKALSLDQADATSLYWNGLAHYYLSRFDRAEPNLSRLYGKNPEMELQYPFGLLPLGVMHANLGRIEEAGRELRRYLEIMPAQRVSAEQRSQIQNQIATWESTGLLKPVAVESALARKLPE